MNKYWSSKFGKHIPRADIDAFLKDILDVCYKHNIGISHQDGHGSFVFDKMSKDLEDWIRSGNIGSI